MNAQLNQNLKIWPQPSHTICNYNLNSEDKLLDLNYPNQYLSQHSSVIQKIHKLQLKPTSFH